MIIWYKVNIIIDNLYTVCFLFTVRELSISEENAHLAQCMFLAKCRSACPNVFKMDIYLMLILAVTNALVILYLLLRKTVCIKI